jgi:hypothetical protein
MHWHVDESKHRGILTHAYVIEHSGTKHVYAFTRTYLQAWSKTVYEEAQATGCSTDACGGALQASVVVGELGVQMADPDQYALDTMASILNSFGGRLFDQV